MAHKRQAPPSIAVLTRKNAAAYAEAPFFDNHGLSFKPVMTVSGHYSWSKEAEMTTHTDALTAELVGYAENKTDLLVEELFTLAMKFDPKAKGARDIVARLPVGEGPHVVTIVIQTKDADDDAYKNDLRPVIERFLAARRQWDATYPS